MIDKPKFVTSAVTIVSASYMEDRKSVTKTLVKNSSINNDLVR